MKQEEMLCIKNQMIAFLQDELGSRGFNRAILGLSGGLDSAVVAFLLKEALNEKFEAVLMPSLRSAKQHFEDALMLAESLQIPHQVIPLEPYERSFLRDESVDRMRYGNFCARMRMMILYDLAFKNRALVVGTSNKSERILGYGTIFGDLACAINPIGDMFKSDLFAFAKFLGIPKKIVEKKPSADLFAGQSDEDDLRWSYQVLDSFLKDVLQRGLSFEHCDEIFDHMRGQYEEEFLESILHRIQANTFKLHPPKVLILQALG